MKTLHLSILILTATGIITGINFTYAPCVTGPNGTQECAGPPPPPISVQIDKSLYMGNETIVITGHVLNPEPGKTVHIQILNSTFALVKDYQTTESANGTYSLQIKANFDVTGQYDVHVFVQSGLWNETEFMFIQGPYKLVIGDKTYPINYIITSGALNKIKADIPRKALIVNVKNAEGKLTLELPKNVIDATSYNENKNNFDVLIGEDLSSMTQADFKEVLPNNTGQRVLEINIPFGGFNSHNTWEIKITGTKIVPEFPLVQVVLVISIALLILFHRIRI